MKEKVLVMGAGHQGLAMAAHLSAHLVDCYVWNRSESNISDIANKGSIVCTGILNGEVKIKKISTDIESVLQKIIMITTPSTGHKDIAKVLARYVDSTYTIILNPGRTFGVLEFISELKDNGCTSLPLVAETQTILYTCRRDEANGVRIFALKDKVKISTWDSSNVNKVIECIPQCIRSYFVPAQSYIETSMGNVGMILHCAPVLMNIGWIENRRVDFEYYYEGISESISSVLEKLDRERIIVAERMGYKIESISEWLMYTYHVYGKNLYEQLQNNVYYRGIDAPLSIHHRYIEEDVPNGLVALESAALYYNISTPVTSTLIDFANIVMGVDYRKCGRNYAALLNKLANH